MSASESPVRLAARVYEMRDAARNILGDRYAQKMAEFRKPIEIVQRKLKTENPIIAAADICRNVEAGGFEVIFLMAAACEMVDPSSASTVGEKP